MATKPGGCLHGGDGHPQGQVDPGKWNKGSGEHNDGVSTSSGHARNGELASQILCVTLLNICAPLLTKSLTFPALFLDLDIPRFCDAAARGPRQIDSKLEHTIRPKDHQSGTKGKNGDHKKH